MSFVSVLGSHTTSIGNVQTQLRPNSDRIRTNHTGFACLSERNREIFAISRFDWRRKKFLGSRSWSPFVAVMKVILLIALLAIGGTSAARPRRVVGGLSISSEIAASLVSIRFNHEHVCGGTLVSNKIVLTMARCILNSDSQRASKLSVKTALSMINGDDHRYKIRRIVCSVHKKVTSAIPLTSVVALILTKKIPSSEYVTPLNRPTRNMNYLQSSIRGNLLMAQLIAVNEDKLQTSENPIEAVNIQIDYPLRPPMGSDYFAGVFSPAFYGKPLIGQLSSVDIGSPLIHNGVLIGLLREREVVYAAYLDVYEYSKFIDNVLSDKISAYIVL